MSTAQMREVQMLRRQALWFREFARLGLQAKTERIDVSRAGQRGFLRTRFSSDRLR